MNILITGAGGFLGAALVRRLQARGHANLRCLVRSKHALRDIPGAEVMTGNLLSPAAAARAVEGVDLIIHAAAAMRGAAADMVLNTVVASRHLLEALGGRRPRIVLVSSFSVYGTAAMARNAVLDEASPLEPHPELRDPYSFAKLRQEKLFEEYQRKLGFELVTVRPGVIYGEGGGAISSRVGQFLFGVFLNLGHGNRLPLCYVDNCAEAIAVAALHPQAANQVYNVCDDDLPTCSQYLREYRRQVQDIRVLPVPYSALMAVSWAVEKYHSWSHGQLPAVFTRYLTRTLWKGTRFDNSRIKGLGWTPMVTTTEALRRAFAYHRAQLTA